MSETPEMVERVARALLLKHQGEDSWDAVSTNERDAYRDLARAAIAAMREPTEAMIRAGDGRSDARIVANWQSMADAALKEKP